MFDPNQAGLKAAFRAVRALNAPTADETQLQSVDRDDARDMTVPGDGDAILPRDAAREPAVPFRAPTATAREAGAPRTLGRTRIVSHERLHDEDPSSRTDPPGALQRVNSGAVYSLEFSTHCPHCSREVSSVRVSRLLRTQVSFTSTLPRKGYIIVCPECEGILSAALSGLI